MSDFGGGHAGASQWGPGLIGCIIALSLYGVALAQTWFYWRAFPRDGKHLKYLGALTLSYFIPFVVQIFYGHRVWIISAKNRLLTASVLYAGSALSSVICDVFITGSVIFYLREGRSGIRRTVLRTETLVQQIIVMFVNMGVLTWWYMTPQGKNYVGTTTTILSKCYVNSLLAILSNTLLSGGDVVDVHHTLLCIAALGSYVEIVKCLLAKHNVDTHIDTLTHLATTYALSHGLLYLPSDTQPQDPCSAIHAPLSLIPSPVPRASFTLAKRLQHIYNDIYARIAMDEAFLDRVMGAVEGVGKADEFVGTLWRGWKEVREEGLVQTLQLGLFRSDYLLHAPDEAAPSLKQVEFNTISSSFGPLSERAAALHRYLHAATGYYGLSPHLTPDNFPPNTTTAGLAQGLAEAHNAYAVPTAQILFVVQQRERNVFDQRWLEYELLHAHAIHVVRQTFDQLAHSIHIHPTTRALHITPPSSSSPIEISTIYFRAGYTPSDFSSPTHYATRIALERTLAIKCPSLPLQLAGGKKVQEALTRHGLLDRLLHGRGYSEHDLDEVRSTWMHMWALDDPCPPPPSFFSKAIGARIPLGFREAWIAMELIDTPAGVGSYLVRAADGGAGAGTERQKTKSVKAEVISELGIFGWALFGAGEVVSEAEAGWLVRTKGTESNEGGVAAGFSVLDSVLLV
ncbi:hypothetical protein SERLADRAFT_408898 [Serpula lacrymans var. lacrymans S7.9]|uniref:Uncharacterized protein n=1 Tax=Serpula lacrymans var. lacrymans (strain S7.9) TaxID=578457 RepID=F8P0J1_SERL9|nr:uncharacterized protein SERLADRAFT_408898 [Serpula lacrymans var. lacrymans S7.9]EGO23546.1 hypothetical protein SERLADRAFT_408898 [Serpula lacrymans var. lacrymans S7.9]